MVEMGDFLLICKEPSWTKNGYPILISDVVPNAVKHSWKEMAGGLMRYWAESRRNKREDLYFPFLTNYPVTEDVTKRVAIALVTKQTPLRSFKPGLMWKEVVLG
jgi:hypothetical protein